MTSRGTTPPLRLHLAVGGVLAVVCVLLPVGPGRDALYTLVSAGSVAVMAAGVRLHRPRQAHAWWLLVAGMATWATGDALWALFRWVLHVTPFPSAADVLYLACYPLLAAGYGGFVRARGGHRDRDGLVDAAILTVAFALLSWVLLLRPSIEAAGTSVLARVLAGAYPAGDVLVLALLVRLLTTGGARASSFRYLVAGAALMLLADCGYQYVTLATDYSGGLLTLPWLCGYVALGAAALHPSMRRLTDAEERPAFGVTRARLAALTVAGLLSPGTLLLQLALGARLEAWAVALASAVLFLLVMVRMSGLVGHLQERANRMADLARTDTLTGLANRRTGDAELARLQVRARREGLPLCVAVLDLDRFKEFNDTYGHQAGDSLLVQASAAWHAALLEEGACTPPSRAGLLARWGGEEFVLLLLGHELDAAGHLVDRLRRRTPAGQSFSAGVARWADAEGAGELFARADAALYAAKRAGRDRVLLAGAAGTTPAPPEAGRRTGGNATAPAPRAGTRAPSRPGTGVSRG
ncbi:GGDEF domain-containing protein [Kineococcus esterisolvens]|uniref:GGDEF domain-containing protein n=1 Tax=unclassified Kineococcus TaxID=2621656 RepID=UPI003D7C827A